MSRSECYGRAGSAGTHFRFRECVPRCPRPHIGSRPPGHAAWPRADQQGDRALSTQPRGAGGSSRTWPRSPCLAGPGEVPETAADFLRRPPARVSEPAALQTQALYVFSLKCFQGGDKAGSGRINMFHSGAYSFSKPSFPLCSPGGGEDKGPRGHLRAVTPQRGRGGARRRFSTETCVAVHPGAPAAWRQGLGHLLLAVAGDSAGQEGLGCEPRRPIRSATPLQPKGPSSRAGVIPPASFET